MISQIAAMSLNRTIGKDGQLPWHLPEDLKFFREMTKNRIILMGRKTFESLGKPLPSRLNVVVTRDPSFRPDGTSVFSTLPEALAFCATQTAHWGKEIFIIGGGEIYKQTLSLTDRIYLTVIEQSFEGDAKFPEFSENEFTETKRENRSEPIPFSFRVYERNAVT